MAAMDETVREIKTISGRPGPSKEHEHDEHSVAFVLRGATSARAGRERLEAKAGQLVLIAAGVPHECRPLDPSSWGYTLFLIEPGSSAALDDALVRSKSGALVLEAMNREIGALAEAGTAARRAEVLAAIERALAAAFVEGDTAALAEKPWRWGLTNGQEACDPRLAAVESSLRGSLARNESLDELARRARMDKYSLVRAFKATYGLSPHAYLLNLRINEAKRLLRSGDSPIEAALSCGFCDQSHFTRAFSRRVGLCPAEYARTYKT